MPPRNRRRTAGFGAAPAPLARRLTAGRPRPDGDLATSDCEAQCTDALLQTSFMATSWQCYFRSSCRQVFDYDVCNAQASTSCH